MLRGGRGGGCGLGFRVWGRVGGFFFRTKGGVGGGGGWRGGGGGGALGRWGVGLAGGGGLGVGRMRARLEPLGIATDGAVEYRVPIDGEVAARAAGKVPENAIGFIPGSRGEGKRWAAAGFAAVISELAERHPVVLFGS